MTVPDPGFRTYSRSEWRALARPAAVPPDEVDLAEDVAAEVGLPTDEILEVYPAAVPTRRSGDGRDPVLGLAVDSFLSAGPSNSPFIVGVTGWCGGGEEHRGGRARGAPGPGPPPTRRRRPCTDAFLLPNAELEARGLAERKGFPDTYDRAALLGTLASIRAGTSGVEVPAYSHLAYDIVAGDSRTIDRPDVVVVEGLDVLQTGPADAGGPAVVADFIDVAVYVDAAEHDAAAWFEQRLMGLRGSAGDGPFLAWLRSLSDDKARDVARTAWSQINLVNLRHHVAPSRQRANVVIHKDAGHRVDEVRVRRP